MITIKKAEFKERWDGDEDGGHITFDDIACCAVAWGVCSSPKTMKMELVRYIVLKTAHTADCEEFKPTDNPVGTQYLK